MARAAALSAPGLVLPMKLFFSLPSTSKRKVEGNVPSQAGSPMAVATGSGSGASSTTEGSPETPKRRRSSFTRPTSSGRSMLTSSTATPFCRSVESVFRIRGNSSRHAAHQVAQKWSTTGFPDPAMRTREEASETGRTRGSGGTARRTERSAKAGIPIAVRTSATMLDLRGGGCPQFRAVHVTILSRKLAIYTTRRLAQAARLRGARVRVLDPLGVEMHLDDQPSAFYRRKKLPRTDVIVPRIAPSVQAYGLAVVNHFAMMGVTTLNDAGGIAASRNKMRALQLLAARGVAVPPTVMAASAADLRAMVELVGGLPVLIKILTPSERPGVMVAESLQSKEAALEAVLARRHNLRG